ncbi:MAG: hypothetical protein GX235_01520 [Clostridiales bacterium]|nr:hypothetical protein [Clostridiales bacterium]
MRTFIKEQLVDLLDSMQQLHMSLVKVTDEEQRTRMLTDCQQAAITVGEIVEKEPSDNHAIIQNLEKYCEEIFSLCMAWEEAIYGEKLLVLNELIIKVKALLSDISPVYHVVFMPYKASMWDSLESIWRACREDGRCECCVMPIPYFEFDSENEKWEYRYEGEQFPEEVPIIHYNDYSLEQNQPDVAYIHNPYDGRNWVTSIHPVFYSDKIKKYIRKLVYVPYYVTGGFIAEEHLELPVYHNMDYMIVQSEYAKSFCRGTYYYDKILPFGSPKLDRVIRLCREGSVIPEQWKPLLNGKKVLMLNTSIGCFLLDGSVYLQKIKYICEVINNQNEVALIWRPHPLLEATIKSMRPHLLPEYKALKAYFIESKIGVFDETPDISRAVALSDGYIGEEGTSVINLFGAAGKPIFILNNYITGVFTEEEKRKVHITDMVKQNNKIWFTTNLYNALFNMNKDTREMHYVGRAKEQPKWQGVYPYLTSEGKKLLLSPNAADSPAIYDTTSGKMELIGTDRVGENLQYRKIVPYGNRIFYLPIVRNYIAEFNLDAKEWIFHTDCIQEMRKGRGNREEPVFEYAVFGEDMWISATYTNYVLRFHMTDGTYALYPIGDKENGYSGIAADEEYLWLAEVHCGNIVRWNRCSGEIRIFPMPEGFRLWQNSTGRRLAHLSLIDMGPWIVTVPGCSNCMVKLDKVTGEVSLLLEDFWKKAEETGNGYHPDFFVSSEFGAKLDQDTVIVQRNCDDATAILNIEDETYEVFYPVLTEEDFAKLTEGEDGFEKAEMKSGFFRRESRIFSLEGFMDDLTHDRLEKVRIRQIEDLSTLAANLDGTCGSKVHEYMMDVLENNE